MNTPATSQIETPRTPTKSVESKSYVYMTPKKLFNDVDETVPNAPIKQPLKNTNVVTPTKLDMGYIYSTPDSKTNTSVPPPLVRKPRRLVL